MNTGFNSSAWVLLLFVTLLGGCSSTATENRVETPDIIGYSVNSSLPHDPKAFTQGFTIHNGQLYESTGETDSWIGIVNIKTGVADRKVEMKGKYFGEGITIFGGKVYQLTWRERTGFVYDLDTFTQLKKFDLTSDGWGITHDSTHLIRSDGTEKLYFQDTATFAIVKTVAAHYKNEPVKDLNELEYVNGWLYANIWQTSLIAKINPATGEVVGFLDLSALTRQAKLSNASADVLNGIAWHEGTKSLLVTGKYWPFIFVLKLKS